jgi:energy-coupling factor transport system ATP-binding protein
VIQLEGVTYRYPSTEFDALASIDLQVEAGAFIGVVGANGAGKSTLCYTLAGFIPHFYGGDFQGAVHVAGHDLREQSAGQIAGDVGLVFQDPFNQISGARFTVREEIAFGLENIGLPREQMDGRIDRVLALTGLVDEADRSPYALSGGQQQRLALASVMALEPSVLVLDEPTSQLDPAGTKSMIAALHALTRSGRTTVVLAEHKLEWVAAFADRVIALADGRLIADGPPAETLALDSVIESGVGQTRYTRAARRARQSGLVAGDKPLPVTLEQALDFFQ